MPVSPHLCVRISLWTLPEVTSQTFRGHRIESEGAPTRLFGTSNYNFLTVSLVLHFCRFSLGAFGAFTSACPFGFLLIPPMLETVIKPLAVI